MVRMLNKTSDSSSVESGIDVEGKSYIPIPSLVLVSPNFLVEFPDYAVLKIGENIDREGRFNSRPFILHRTIHPSLASAFG